MYNAIVGNCVGLMILIVSISSAVAQVYPSAGTAWVINAQQQAATAPQWQQQFSSTSAVSQWEDDHADISIGGSYDQYQAKKIT